MPKTAQNQFQPLCHLRLLIAQLPLGIDSAFLDFQKKLTVRLVDRGFGKNGLGGEVQIAVADDLTIFATNAAVKVVYEFIDEFAPPKSSGRIAPEPWALKFKPSKTLLVASCTTEELMRRFPVTGPNAIPREIKRIGILSKGAGVRYLGSPIGHDDFCLDFCLKTVEGFQDRLDGICALSNKQIALNLFRFTVVTRYNHIARTTSPFHTTAAAELMDSMSRAGLNKLLELSGERELSDTQWMQAMLPIKLSGLGLLSAKSSIYNAYVGSLGQCLHDMSNLETDFFPECLKGMFTDMRSYEGDSDSEEGEPCPQIHMIKFIENQEENFSKWNDYTKLHLAKYEKQVKEPSASQTVKQAVEDAAKKFVFPSIEKLVQTSHGGLQRILSQAKNACTFTYLLEVPENTKDDIDRLLSSSGPAAGGFLTAPTCRPDNRMKPNAFVTAVHYRLGINPLAVANIPVNAVCRCGKVHDYSSPKDIINCNQAGGCTWIARHNYPARTFARIAKEAGHTVLMEEKTGGIFNNGKVDVSILDFVKEPLKNKKGSVQGSKVCAHFDFRVTDPTNKSNSAGRSFRGKAADKHAKEKYSSAGALHVMAPDIFIPAILETYGLVHIDLRKALFCIAENHIYQSVKDNGFSDDDKNILKGIIVNEYYQRLSVSLMKGIAMNIQTSARIVMKNNLGGYSRRAPPLTHARAQAKLGAKERGESSGLAQLA